MTDGFLLGWAFRENLRFRRIFPWIVVAIALFVISKVVSHYNPGQSAQETYVLLSGVVVYKLTALVGAIFAMGVIAAEVEQKTIVYLLTRPIPRFRILFWRAVGAITAVALVSAVSVAAVSLGVYGTRTNPLFGNDLVAVTLGAAGYTALFVFVSLLVNRAMAYCLVFAFGWETAVPAMQGDVSWLSLNTFMAAIGQHPEGSAGTGTGFLASVAGADKTTIAPALGGQILLGITAFFLVASMFWFSSFEYLPREDAE